MIALPMNIGDVPMQASLQNPSSRASHPRRRAPALRTGSAVLGAAVALVAIAADPGIPAGPAADAVMAGPDEIYLIQDWASRAFTGQRRPGPGPAVGVELRRQDHSALRFGESCLETPIRIGSRSFAHGLGTHANSEIVLDLPPGARAFKALVGIDSNFDTGGQRGTVQFSVEAGGRELLRTPTVRGSDAAVPVEVVVPEGVRQLVLKTDTTADGPGHDQADWADARVVLADGREVWADADRQPLLARDTPFSFVYAGVESRALLPQWPRASQTAESAGRTRSTTRWADPATGLRVAATVTTFDSFPAAEWVLEFENGGTNDTPLIERVQALDAQLRTGYFRRPAVIHTISGDVCGERSFVPQELAVEASQPVTLAPAGGRPSNGAFPFLSVEYGDEGVLAAIGWSGQWAARLDRTPAGPTRLQAGMERTRLRLHPGERIRSPRILVMPWRGDRWAAHNRFRRLLLFEYVPKQDGRPLRLPVASQCFDRYSGTRPEWSTEAGQLEAVRATRELGCDTHWFDAAWFQGGFPDGVGNWFCKPAAFPNGLQPIGAACRQSGLQFLVWFEPERVARGTQIAIEHPEFVFGGTNGGLFKLNEPAARRWLTDLLSQRIAEYGLDVYRNDFNIDPLGFWRAADPPDRQGITEIRYVEGHYALWDELRARHPGLWIDNCASGGRRIDLETLMRSVPLWRSDTGCSPGHADWDQSQALGLSRYVPLYTACAWEPSRYVVRSAATAGLITQFDYLDPAFRADRAAAVLAEAKADRKFWYGDFYPLTAASTAPDGFAAWQLHRPDLDAGLVLAFRRRTCPYPTLEADLRAVRPAGRYRVESVDDAGQRVVRILKGRELADGFELHLPVRGSSLRVRYEATR
jgi:alpha-galactosidase